MALHHLFMSGGVRQLPKRHLRSDAKPFTSLNPVVEHSHPGFRSHHLSLAAHLPYLSGKT